MDPLGLGRRVRIRGLESNRDLNGRDALVMGMDEETGRLIINIRALEGEKVRTVKIKRQNLVPFNKEDTSASVTSFCDGCSRPSPIADLKTCGRCKKAKYCSEACQQDAWTSHKKECKLQRQAKKDMKAEKGAANVPENPNSEAWRARADKARKELFDAFAQHGVGVFASQFCSEMRQSCGVVVFHFSGPEHCEDFATNFQVTMNGRGDNKLTFPAHYRKWPDASDYLKLGITVERKIDTMVAACKPNHEAVVVIVVHQDSRSDAVQAFAGKFPFDGDGRVNAFLSKKKPQAGKTSDDLFALAVEITRSSSYRACRQLVLNVHKTMWPANQNDILVVLIRNIFDPAQDAFETNQLKDVTPKILSKALKKTVKNGAAEWGRPVTCFFLTDPRFPQRFDAFANIAPMVRGKVAEVCRELDCMQNELFTTHAVVCMGAYVDPKDDRLLYQISVMSVEGD